MTDAKAPATEKARSLVLEQEVSAPAEAVWQALTTPDGLRQWFPLDARVEPGEGGSVWLSWGPGSEGEAPIHIWDLPSRFGWTESYGEDESGRPIKVAVDFHIEGREGKTVVRLVQSGFGASEDWDEMYNAVKDGWTYFLFNLAFYFLKHRDKSRRLVWRRFATDLARDVVWERLVGSALIGLAAGHEDDIDLMLDQIRSARVVSEREGYHFAATLPELDDSAFFVELEGTHVGLWLSTYGMDDDRVAQLQNALDARIEGALGAM